MLKVCGFRGSLDNVGIMENKMETTLVHWGVLGLIAFCQAVVSDFLQALSSAWSVTGDHSAGVVLKALCVPYV